MFMNAQNHRHIEAVPVIGAGRTCAAAVAFEYAAFILKAGNLVCHDHQISLRYDKPLPRRRSVAPFGAAGLPHPANFACFWAAATAAIHGQDICGGDRHNPGYDVFAKLRRRDPGYNLKLADSGPTGNISRRAAPASGGFGEGVKHPWGQRHSRLLTH